MAHRDRFAVLAGAVIGDDAAAAAFRALALDGRGVGRHDDGRPHAEETGRFSDALSVVA